MTFSVSELREKVSGGVLVPGDEGYEASLHRWAANAERKAGVIVLVENTSDVAAALDFGRKAGMEIAIAGGKHSASGASSSEGGMVIDLSRMRKTRVDTEKNHIIAQGGALWLDVDQAGAEHKLATVGGTVNHTGIGGLTLGGGYGWLSGQYGMVVDNLVDVEIVLANGKVVHANESQNADLFWGIRGGGCNFGVVTEFTYQAYPHDYPVYSGMLLFLPHQAQQLVDTFNKWEKAEGQNPKTANMFVVGVPPPHFQPTYMLMPFFDGPEDEGRRIFKPFFDLGPVADLTKQHPYVEQNGLMNPMVDHGSRRYMKATAVHKMTVPVLQTLLAKLTELTTHIGPESFHTACIYEHFAMAKIRSKDEYATAFNNRGNWTGISLLPAWQSPEHDAFARDWVRGVVDALAEVEKADESVSEAVVGKRAYYNGSTGDEKVTQVFRENYPRLRKIKRKYDPELLFRKWFPIVPADE